MRVAGDIDGPAGTPAWKLLDYADEAAFRFWERRSCGVTCLRLAYNTLLGLDTRPGTLTEELLMAGAYSEENGWIHEGLADHARSNGLFAERLRVSNKAELVGLLRLPGVCIASVGPSFDSPGSRGHLVIAEGVSEDGQIVVRDPYTKAESGSPGMAIEMDVFWEHFSGRIIRLSNVPE